MLSAVSKLTLGGSSDAALFGSRGKRAKWSDFVLEVPQRYKDRRWGVSYDVLYRVMEGYLAFELTKPVCLRKLCEGRTVLILLPP